MQLKASALSSLALSLALITLTPAFGGNDATDKQLAEARASAAALTQQLGAALKKALAEGGPAGAVEVCRGLAPEIAGRLSRERGIKLTRVSLKPRNPLLGAPDAWEQEALLEFDRNAAAGAKPETLEHSALVTEPAGKYFRYMKALPVQPLCLTCHGSTVPDDVKRMLERDYPADQAVGYTAGQIRGAISIKQPLP